jgi:hypothetical protein
MQIEPRPKATGDHGAGGREQRPVRPSVEDLLAEELTRCGDCGRTPLLGEHVHLYASADLVCELCRMLRPDEPVLSAKVTPRLGPGYRNDPARVVRVSRR